MKAARAQSQSVDLSVAWQEWQVSQEAKITVYRLITLEKEIALVAEVDQRLGEILDLSRRAAGEGTETQLDLVAAEAAANQANANLSDLTNQFHEGQINLNRIMGFPAQTQFKLQDSIDLPDHWDPPSTVKIMGELEQRRLDLVALHRGYESQDATVRTAILRQFPAINIGLNYARDTGNVVTTGFGVSISLPVFNRNRGQIKIEEATRQALFDEYIARLFEARSEIEALQENARFLNEQIKNAQAAEPGLERLVDSYRAAVGNGSADILSYYTAWNNLTEKRIEILNLKEQLMETRIGLEITSGLYNVDITEGAGN